MVFNAKTVERFLIDGLWLRWLKNPNPILQPLVVVVVDVEWKLIYVGCAVV
jgi:hypothetical protein